jgi:hypothetical protein
MTLMTTKKSKPRHFNGLSYRQVQRANSQRYLQLSKAEQKAIKIQKLKNVGWENVIKLYEKLDELPEPNKFEDFSLEDLFLEADRIGNKYLSQAEIVDFNQTLAQQVSEIAEIIDEQFPSLEAEFIDFRKHATKVSARSRSSKRR